MKRVTHSAALFGLALSACSDGGVPPYSNPPAFTEAGIETDYYGKCFGRDVTPAQTHTVTDQELVKEEVLAPDGRVLEPAVYQTVTNQQIIRERREVLFEVVCPSEMNSGFIASVQRALAARGFYQAPITGVMDDTTTAAVRLYQRQQTGVDSPLLSVDAAKVLGLVALTPTDLGM